MMRFIVVTVIGLLLASCAKVVWVKEQGKGSAKYENLAGIPFYFKTEKFSQTTVYADTWLRATLTVEKKLADTKDGKEVLVDEGKQLYTKNLTKRPGENLSEIKLAILRADNADLTVAEKVINQFNTLPEIDHTTPRTPDVIKNVIESVWVVDSSRTYYLNAPLPWFGAGNLTQELNSDGTLLKATSNPETKLAEGISSLVPFKEYFTGKFVKSAPAAAATSSSTNSTLELALNKYKIIDPKATLVGKIYVYILSLNINEVGYEYTLTKPPQTDRPDIRPIPFNLIANGQAAFSRKEIGGEKEEEKKEEGQKIGIAGSINFPKDWGVTKPAEK